ncbi:MAG: ATP-binding protein [Candidatus Dadabacteria bacterium]|nr:ATP-binding protein [Candidatus Dadabacteria bacterium]
MIISFSIENWMSFRDLVSFLMVASRERQHGNRIPKVEKYQMRILPVTAIYGANASGKTNFFRALDFVKNLVLEGTGPDRLIPVEPHRLISGYMEKPSKFRIELLVNEKIYELSFAATRKTIVEEKLIQITSTGEKTLYDRQGDEPNFHRSLSDKQFLLFAFRGTRENQLFLTNSISQKVLDFKPVYDWFRNSLQLIAPDSVYRRFEFLLDEEHPMRDAINKIIPQLDTGISSLNFEKIRFDSIPLEEGFKNKLKEEIKEGRYVEISVGSERFVFTRTNGDVVANKLVTFHPKTDGTDAKFEFHQESEGSRRVIDLLPAFLGEPAFGLNRVYVIDELDRSLHPLLTRKLIQTYLDSCNAQSRGQLMFTMHDVSLMDQRLFRRDEMWVTEKNSEGSSEIFSFNDYKGIRYDKDIRKSYLQGRLGGIPRFSLNNAEINWREDS